VENRVWLGKKAIVDENGNSFDGRGGWSGVWTVIGSCLKANGFGRSNPGDGG